MEFLFKNIYQYLDRLFKHSGLQSTAPKKLIEYSPGDPNRIKDKAYDIMIPLIPETKVIHYKNTIEFDHDLVAMMDRNETIRANTIGLAEMPFDTCFFETHDINGLTGFGDNELYRLAGVYYPTVAYWLHKIEDGVIGLQIYKDPVSGMINSITDVTLVESSLPDARRRLELLMYVLTEPLTRGFLSHATDFNIKYREGPNRRKKFHHVNEVVVVDPSYPVESTRDGDSIDIQYSHRFWVRGHWRKIPGRAGTDSRGNPVEGRTWVRSFIKGPDDKPLINRKWLVK